MVNSRREALRALWQRLVAIITVVIFLTSAAGQLSAQPKKVVLQAFWWNCKNNNYNNGWWNYLADIAPRLKGMGIDAVWIPSVPKGANGGTDPQGFVYEMGYSTFDHYDLGDKYQRGTLKTRFGTKDEYLRMIAVMHANGIDVIQDIVLNHIDGAGSATGAGGQDPYALANYNDGRTSGYKNFRYVSYATPATDETANNYLSRSGRWLKNWENFYPNQFNNQVNTNDINTVLFGPDVSYENNAYGTSSNALYNPAQASNYMYDGVRNWGVWLKKQAGFDGVRLDAVKHFPTWLTDAFLNDLQNNAGWASGTSNMFAVGEFVGGASQLDTWCANVSNRSGTFDFSLRGAIYGMVSGGGGYYMADIKNAQQVNRSRTVPFVNNHDTFRPQVDANGNYIGWNTGEELAAHIDPFDPRLAAAYAMMCAVDGSPQVFFEDLFNVGGTSKRFTHQPTSTTDLPVRDDIANIIRCFKKFDFQSAAYKVRTASNGEYFVQGNNGDALVIERSAKAIIAASDAFATEQQIWVNSDFPAGTVLKDYGGSYAGFTTTVQGDQRVLIKIPPCNGSLTRRGYSIWAPTSQQANFDAAFAPAVRTTTQEWDMSNDLGDSHASSLKQGGALPANSTSPRTVGRIYNQGGKTITLNTYPTNLTQSLTVYINNSAGTQVSSKNGTGNQTLTYTPVNSGWYTIRIKNAGTTSPAQRVVVKATYTSVQTASTGSNPPPAPEAPPQNEDFTIAQEVSVENFSTAFGGITPNPVANTASVNFSIGDDMPVKITMVNAIGQTVMTITDTRLSVGEYSLPVDASALSSGVYMIHIQLPDRRFVQKMVVAR
ncbi:MAG: T9SS type A sorting domain-containing protein [Candidatus Kapaibacteriota bacterium]